MPFPRREGRQFKHQVPYGVEVAYEGHARHEGDKEPGGVLAPLAPGLIEGPGLLVELHSLVARAFKLLLHPHEDTGPHGLGAGVATPDAARGYRYGKQGEGRDDEEESQKGKILRPEGEA